MSRILTEDDFRASGDELIGRPRRSRCVVQGIGPDNQIEIARIVGSGISSSMKIDGKFLSRSVREQLRVGSVLVRVMWTRQIGDIVKTDTFWLIEEEKEDGQEENKEKA